MSDEYDSVEEEVEEVEEDEESVEEVPKKKKRGKKWKVRCPGESACWWCFLCASKLSDNVFASRFLRIQTSPSGPCQPSSCILKRTDHV